MFTNNTENAILALEMMKVLTDNESMFTKNNYTPLQQIMHQNTQKKLLNTSVDSAYGSSDSDDSTVEEQEEPMDLSVINVVDEEIKRTNIISFVNKAPSSIYPFVSIYKQSTMCYQTNPINMTYSNITKDEKVSKMIDNILEKFTEDDNTNTVYNCNYNNCNNNYHTYNTIEDNTFELFELGNDVAFRHAMEEFFSRYLTS